MRGNSVGVGHPALRVDAYAKVTGQAQYTGDLEIPGMIHGKVLRSPYPHARILNINVQEALVLPGVVAVLTANSMEGAPQYYGHAIKDRPLLAFDRVRFVGEPIAAVAAEEESIAHKAIGLIEVEYEDLPIVGTITEALAEDAPILHETESLQLGLFHGLGDFKPEGNCCYHHSFSRGDVDSAFAQADIVVEGEYLFPAVYQYALEPHTVIARWEEDWVTVWSSCQHPFLVRAELADLFNLPANHVRVIVPYLGGGFGSKSYTKMEPITVALAKIARRPVRIANQVHEAMVTSRRHGMRCWMRTAATATGKLLAREARFWLDTGAYADNGPRVVATAADAAPGPYRWEHMRVNAWGVYTNTPPSGSYRAFGSTHLQWIGESQIDEVARKAGVDCIEIRTSNLLRPGEEVRPGGKPLDADLVGDIRLVAEALEWYSPRAPNTGRGVSVGLLAAGARPVSSAILRFEAQGTANLLVSSTEMGQGARTVFSQLVAEELGLALEQVRVLNGDTDVTPYDRSTGASRSTSIAGKAVQQAAAEVRDQILTIASRYWDVPSNALEVRHGAVWHSGESLSFQQLFEYHFGFPGGELIGRGVISPEGGKGSYAEGPVFWEVCIGGVEIHLDRETGRIQVGKIVSLADVGKAINPQLVKAQEMGASLQGLGNALMEEMVMLRGQLLNSTLLDYYIPTTADIPEIFCSTIVENEDGPGPFGAKGVGEGAFAAMPAAIVNALGEMGVRAHVLPLTPDRVWQMLRTQSAPEDETVDG